MNKKCKRILPILLGILIIASSFWYLFVYDRDFTRDMLMQCAHSLDQKGHHSLAAWLYDQAYLHSDGDEQVAIALANHFKASGNYTQAEVTLTRAIAQRPSAALYIALSKTYIDQNKLQDAVTMLDSISDPAIQMQISAMRPAAPVTDRPDTNLSRYETIHITAPGGKLYLTTDGDYPSLKDQPSDGIVDLVGGSNIIRALCVAENGLVSPLVRFEYTVSNVIELVTFQDPSLEDAVRKALGVDYGVDLYSNDLWTITELTLPNGLGSTTELSYLPYLQKLTILNSTGTTMDGLRSLGALETLIIRNTDLTGSDLQSIAALQALRELTLSNCALSNIDVLSELRKLTYLDLSENSIRDFTSLSFTSGLTYLDLSSNALTSLNAASALSSLQVLYVSGNSLPSVGPLASCTQLRVLDVSNNEFLASLSGLENLVLLESVNASATALTSVQPLADCVNLLQLDVSDNALTDISPLAGLKKLEQLRFANNQVSVLPDWGKDCGLVTIDGSNNLITLINILSGYVNLNNVIMDNNQITSVDALASCENLVKVSVYGNPVTDVSALEFKSIIVHWDYNADT